jgi:hypothetical protein
VSLREYLKNVRENGEIYCLTCAKRLGATSLRVRDEELGLEIEENLSLLQDPLQPVMLNISGNISEKLLRRAVVELIGFRVVGGEHPNPYANLFLHLDYTSNADSLVKARRRRDSAALSTLLAG